jgi:hypothetical protein
MPFRLVCQNVLTQTDVQITKFYIETCQVHITVVHAVT